MSEYINVAKVSALPDPGKLLVEVAERFIVVCHVDGKFYAIDDVCTHDGGTLSDGELSGCELICPRHSAKFDVRDGRALSMPATEATVAHEVKIQGDDILVRIHEV